MNNVHDMGGQQNYGALYPDPDEPLFHSPWERDVLVLTLAMGATGKWNLDESRFARESLPPAYYLSAGYYGIWLAALEQLLLRHGMVTKQELREGRMQQPPVKVSQVLAAKDVDAVLHRGSPVERKVSTEPRFNVGDVIVVRNLHSATHTRMPGFIRGHKGTIARVHGSHVFPDSHAIGLGEDPQWLYNVEFDSTELWGEAVTHASDVHVDCWEPYLEQT